VLDVGCQHGSIGLILAPLWYDIWAIDVSGRYVGEASRNTDMLNDWIQYRVLPVEKAWKLYQMFDVILCLSVLEHVRDFDIAWNSMLDNAYDEALILSIVPIGESWMSEEHTRIFTDDNIYEYFPKSAKVSEIKFSDELGWYAIKYIKEAT
ncbi:MAG TPA: class I SAM-dependent methyltransferase, partial [Methanosarcinales archaeon]|nr:class I SAM-dependent methyltransferase [Methanosarcinales archaeon]